MSETLNEPERKYSVYMALGGVIIIAGYDMAVNSNVEATKDLLFALIGFAGARQAIKSFLKR